MSVIQVISSGLVYIGASLINNIEIEDPDGNVIKPLTTPWTCAQTIYRYEGDSKLGNEVIASKSIPIDATNSHFVMNLSDAETTGLGLGLFVAELIFTNPTINPVVAITDKVRISFTVTD